MSARTRRRAVTAAVASLLSLTLSACTGIAPDGGFGEVADATRDRLGAEPRLARNDVDARALHDQVCAILAAPLDMDGALQVALLNNPGLQASYWQVGIAQADLVQASRLRNPALDFKRTSGGGDIEIEHAFTVDLIGALTTPLAARLEARRFAQAKLDVAVLIEQHAAATRLAWVDAVAASQALDYARQVDASARAGAELAERMTKAGNMNALDLARQQLFQAETAASLARAGQAVASTREALTRLLGLWGTDTGYTLSEHLPELPAAPADLSNVERLAIEQRLDVRAAKLDAESTAANLGLTRATRFVNALDLGPASRSESGRPTTRGYELRIELPLFDWGEARNAKAEALYMQSVQRVTEAAVNARSEARAAYLDERAAWELAAHYRDTVIPLRKRISHEVLLRYNGMLASSLELLADARDQAGAVAAAIDALKDYWRAHARLDAALGGRIPSATSAPAATDTHKDHAE